MIFRARPHVIVRVRPFGIPGTAGILLCVAFLFACGALPAFAAGTYYVDNGSPACSNSGPGTEANPYCTISAAVAARGEPGTTILVKPGVYREPVMIGASGAAGNPLVIQALGSGVVVDGSDDFADTTLWAHASGTEFVAATVTWATLQVFADGQRLIPSTAEPGTLPVGAFRHVSGQGLFVNLGGANPGVHLLRVGRRSYGFRVSGRQWITIQGFTVTRTEDRSIYLTNVATNVSVIGNHVTYSNRYGIQADSCTSITVAGNTVSRCNDNGIHFSSSTSGSLIEDNESYLNARPGVRAANGIMLFGASGNTVQRNRCHDNQDSGFQINAAANDNTLRENLSWANGDHGYDHLTSTGNRHVNNVAYANVNDGFSIEGKSPNTSLHNCIAIDNEEYDLWVDANSAAGFQSDHNIFWNSTAQKPIKYIATAHATLAPYQAASGQDAHSLQQDPLFIAPASGDFHLQPGSPAIDDADAAVPGWLALDADGRARIDVPTVPNTGSGAPDFSDRGGFEHYAAPGGDAAPVVSAPASVAGNENVLVVVNVTVADPDGDPIHLLTANLSGLPAPNDAVFVTNATRTAGTLMWTPSHGGPEGPHAVTFTAANALSGSASTAITVTNVDRAPVIVAAPTATGSEGMLLMLEITVADPDSDAIETLTADLNGLPGASNPSFTANASRTAGTLTWSPGFTEGRPSPYYVTFVATNALAADATTAITIADVDRPPVLSVPAHVSKPEHQQIQFDVTAVDPDGQPLTSLSADLSGLPAGHDGTFVFNATHTAGSFAWRPSYADSGTYAVTFTAGNVLSGSSTTTFTIGNRDRAPVVTAPGSVTATENGTLTVDVTAMDPDGDSITALTANLGMLGSGSNATFTTNGTHSAGTLTWTPTFDQGRGPLYNVVFTARNASSGTATTGILVENVDRAAVVTVPAEVSTSEGTTLYVEVTATDPDGDGIQALTADLSMLPAGHDAVFVHGGPPTMPVPVGRADRGGTHSGSQTGTDLADSTRTDLQTNRRRYETDPSEGSGQGGATGGSNTLIYTLIWTPTLANAPGPYAVTFSATNVLSGSSSTSITVTNADRAPVVSAPSQSSVAEGERLSFEVMASDADGETITALTAAGLPAGATFTVEATHSSAMFDWTPDFDASPGPYTVTFTASNALAGSSSTMVTVTNTNGAPAVVPARSDSHPVPLRGWVDPARSEVRLDVTGRGIVVRIETGAAQAALTAMLAGPGGRVESGPVLAGGDLDGNGIAELMLSFTAADLASAFSGTPVGTHRTRVELIIRWEGVTSSLPIDLTVIRPEGIVVAMAPNPLRENSQIQFILPVAGRVRIEILGVDGRRAAIIADEVRHEAGTVQLTLSRHNFKPGLYFYRVVTGSGSAAGRFVVLGS